jgi:hypothetical protein
MSGGMGREWSSDHGKASEALRKGKPAETDRPCLPSFHHSFTLGLAPHSQLRGAITPTPRQQGAEAPEAGRASPRWGWARLLKRVFAFDMERCPACGRGTLRIIAAITQVDVIRKILRHLKLAPEPPPIAPARACQATFAWTSP